MGFRQSKRAPWLLVAIMAMSSGCATSSAFRAAHAAESVQDYDRAIVEYTKILRDHPNNRTARAALDQAKLRGSQAHFTRARRLAASGKLDEALIEYQLAAELNPSSAEVQREMTATRAQLRTKIAVTDEGKTRLETVIQQSLAAPMPGADLPADVTMPDSLIFRDASSRVVFSAIAQFADLSVAFDPAFRDQPITVDLRNAKLDEALNTVSTATRHFWKVTGQRTVTIVPDTPAKRREYEEEVVRTFYLSNADLKETMDILRIVVDARRIAMLTGTNAITIKDTPDRVNAAARIISAIDKARPEVVIDVELLEVDRTRVREYGLQIASPTTPVYGINGQADINREDLTLRDLRSLTQSDIFLTNLPGLYYRLLKSDTATRVLANPQLRTAEGIAAQARFGERVPVPVTTFAPIAAGGVQTQPITSFNYENIGVNIDITPRTHHDDDVTLAIRIEVSSISGVGFGGLPTFGNRYINTAIRLKDGETNMLAGLIRDEERRVLSGIPGLSDIPVIGRLFAYNRKEAQETDIILTLTPHIVRVLDLRAEDLQAFRVGRDSSSSPSLIDLPPLPPIPPLPSPRPPGTEVPEGTTVVPPAPGTTPRSPLPVPERAQPIKPPVKPPGNGSPDAAAPPVPRL